MDIKAVSIVHISITRYTVGDKEKITVCWYRNYT